MGKKKELLKSLLWFQLIYNMYTVSWSYLFIYVEECLRENEGHSINKEKFINHIEKIKNISIEEKNRLVNISNQYFGRFDNPSCNYGIEKFLKWWEFAIMCCTTIGMHFIYVYYR